VVVMDSASRKNLLDAASVDPRRNRDYIYAIIVRAARVAGTHQS